MPVSLIPGQSVPDLVVPLTGGGRYDISKATPEHLTLIEVYRGLHCPRCQRHVMALHAMLPRFHDLGVDVLALSNDGIDRASRAKDEWGLEQLQLGYDLTQEQAREWGLYLSAPITSNEPHPFAEPATFFVRPDGTLYAASYATSPFARSHWPDWLEGLAAAQARNYPPRGDMA